MKALSPRRADTLSQQVSHSFFTIAGAAWLLLTLVVAGALGVLLLAGKEYSLALGRAGAIHTAAKDYTAGITTEILHTRAYLITGEEQSNVSRQLAHEDAGQRLLALQDLLAASPGISTPSLQRLEDLHRQYDAVSGQLVDMRHADQTSSVMALFEARSEPLVLSMQDASHNLQGEIERGVTTAAQERWQRASSLMLAAAALFVIGSGLAALLLVRTVRPPLQRMEGFERALMAAAQAAPGQPLALPESTGADRAAPGAVLAFGRLYNQLSETNTALLRYISRLNHEANTLLATIVGYGYMVAQPGMRPQKAHLDEYGSIIVHQAQRASHLVEDFTLAAKIDGGQYAPRLSPIHLAPLLRALVDDIVEETHREVRLILQHPPEAQPVVVQADALALEKAARKLIENALAYSLADCVVTVTMQPDPARRVVDVRVRDEGIGIAAADLPLLFQPFSRIKNEINRGSPGSGLGLYIASAIIRQHHGSIHVETQTGAGATFTITLPVEGA